MNEQFYDKTILVTGANGQVGKEFQELSSYFPTYKFLFASRENLPVENYNVVKKYFNGQQIDFCINCAAYTAVDKAETEKEKAFSINAEAVGNLAAICKAHATKLIHISTDYVFSGNGTAPYKEEDMIDPVNIYGASKLRGEELALNNNAETIIIRTSWVYSSFGNNFVKTMLRLMKERESINVVSDQFGSPTYAADLAHAVMKIVEHQNVSQSGIFNYCNQGIISWYDFAMAIKIISKSDCNINAIPTSQFPTPAKRPQYSVLDTHKIRSTFDLAIPGWAESLQNCMLQLA